MDRLFAIIDYLRGRARTTTGELAAHLGVSERTVRRDLVRLQALDIQVETEPGRLGGLRLTRGALLPALRFTDDEALVLALGLKQAQTAGDARLAGAARSAFRRLEHVLTGELGDRIEAVVAALNLEEAQPWHLEQIDSAILLTLSEAVRQRERLRVRHRAPGGQVSDRDLDPYGVVQLVDHWYLTGFCHLRQDIRTFWVDRLQVLASVGVMFEPPTDFDALDTVGRAVSQTPTPGLVNCALWVQSTIEEVRAWMPSYRASLELSDHGVLVRVRAEPGRFRQIALGLLAFSCPVQVIGPAALRATFAELAARALVLATGEPQPGTGRTPEEGRTQSPP